MPPVIPRMNLRERALNVVSRRRAQRMLYRRHTREWRTHIRRRRAAGTYYDGTKKTPYNRHWTTDNASADAVLDEDTLEALRSRARDLERNQGYAKAAADVNVANVVGPRGLRPQSTVSADPEDLPPRYDDLPRISESVAKAFRRDMEAFYHVWAQRATLDGMSDAEVQEVAERTGWREGESFVHRVLDLSRDRPCLTAVELIDPDRISTPPKYASDPRVVNGIRKDKAGRVLGYYVAKRHPGAVGLNVKPLEYAFVPARDMIHRVNHRTRPGQSRGEGELWCVVNLFRDIYDYINAAIVQAEVQACFCAVVEDDNVDEAIFGGQTESETVGEDTAQHEMLMPRAIIRVPVGDGKKIHMMQPGAPTGTFDAFVMRLLRQLSAATGIPYEILASDFSNANYSSTRAAFEQAKIAWRSRQERMKSQYMVKLWNWLVYEAVIAGWVRAPGYYLRREAYRSLSVVPVGWTHIDPLKSASAERIKLEDGSTTLRRVLAAEGIDYDENTDELEREVKDYRARGLIHPHDLLAGRARTKVAINVLAGDGDEDSKGDDE